LTLFYGQSIVIETNDNWNITIQLKGLVKGDPQAVGRDASTVWNLWRACPGQHGYTDPSTWLVRIGQFAHGDTPRFVAEGRGCTYTLTTSRLGRFVVPKNTTIPVSAPMELPYYDALDGYQEGHQAKYFTAESGSFEAATASDNEKVLRQVVSKRPIEWEHNAGIAVYRY
jgi:hypothetical protein